MLIKIKIYKRSKFNKNQAIENHFKLRTILTYLNPPILYQNLRLLKILIQIFKSKNPQNKK